MDHRACRNSVSRMRLPGQHQGRAQLGVGAFKVSHSGNDILLLIACGSSKGRRGASMLTAEEQEEFDEWRRSKAKQASVQEALTAFRARLSHGLSDDDNPFVVWCALVDAALGFTLATYGIEDFRRTWMFALESAENDRDWLAQRRSQAQV